MRHWLDLKPRLAVKSDSIAAVELLADMKFKSPSMNFVGRELALTLSEAAVQTLARQAAASSRLIA
eukprot:3093104-Heterocapsa_arctica.AAC.1